MSRNFAKAVGPARRPPPWKRPPPRGGCRAKRGRGSTPCGTGRRRAHAKARRVSSQPGRGANCGKAPRCRAARKGDFKPARSNPSGGSRQIAKAIGRRASSRAWPTAGVCRAVARRRRASSIPLDQILRAEACDRSTVEGPTNRHFRLPPYLSTASRSGVAAGMRGTSELAFRLADRLGRHQRWQLHQRYRIAVSIAFRLPDGLGSPRRGTGNPLPFGLVTGWNEIHLHRSVHEPCLVSIAFRLTDGLELEKWDSIHFSYGWRSPSPFGFMTDWNLPGRCRGGTPRPSVSIAFRLGDGLGRQRSLVKPQAGGHPGLNRLSAC